MDELHRYRTFPDTRSDSFHRAVPHVAHGKNAWNICFEQEWVPLKSPSLGALSVADQVRASQKEAPFIPLHQVSQPLGARQGSDENEHCAQGLAFHLAGIRTKDRDLFEMRLAVRLDHAGVGPYLDVGCLFNLINQVLGHGSGESNASHQHDDALRVSREIHSRLAG